MRSAGEAQKSSVSQAELAQHSQIPGTALFLNHCHWHFYAFSQAKESSPPWSFSLLQDVISVNYFPLYNHDYKARRQGPLTEV